MKRIAVILLAFLLAMGATTLRAAQPNTLTADEQKDGWTLLFDGQTTKGWHSFKKTAFPATGWVVEDGCLKHLDKGGGGDVVSDGEFEEFDLTWEWKIARGANGGLKYFVTNKRSSPLGHEYQMIDDGAGAAKGGLHATASFYEVVPVPADTKVNPPGQWNSSRVLVRGQHVEHWLNGAKVLEYELGSDAIKAAVARSKFKDVAGFGTRVKGHLLLQDHGGEVCFRNIKLRDLAAAK
jgi:hypothetical protein